MKKMFGVALLLGSIHSYSAFAASTAIPAYGLTCRSDAGARIQVLPKDSGNRVDLEVTRANGSIVDDNSYGKVVSSTDSATSSDELLFGDEALGVVVRIKGLKEESMHGTTVFYTNQFIGETYRFSACDPM